MNYDMALRKTHWQSLDFVTSTPGRLWFYVGPTSPRVEEKFVGYTDADHISLADSCPTQQATGSRE